MGNNIYEFCSSRRVTIPTVALIITLGVLGEQTKPVLSNQIKIDSQNSSAHVLSKLREVRAQRNQGLTASETQNNSENWQYRQVTKSATVPKIELSSTETFLQPSSKSSAKGLKTAPATTVMVSRSQKSALEAGNVPISNLPQKDGVYLYGQSPTPNQIGQGYIVFEKRQAQVKGAMYMPNSEFSCFQGTVDRSGELAMTVNASPDESSSNQVATTNSIPSINDDELSSYAYSVALQDYHQLKSVSTNDQRILQMCNQPTASEYRKLVK
ncbi:hypothetical protein BV372_17580 [Nostoc sp. T09]|uniref:hypothetical protein n=1 Tax=Nostoc sp. T09 TaxID=1932621 RepID=UPI000A3D0CBA|nr:hypothetical protein [Nostoc sp. T09]OUL32997.1 hypothetical protein BV372_17580 [Nostoc sp. T09]